MPPPPISCVACRSRKVKCDRAKPACARCLKLSSTCVYPAARKKYIRTSNSALTGIEARLARIEKHVPQRTEMVGSEDPRPMKASRRTRISIHKDDSFKDTALLTSLGYSETVPPMEVQEELNQCFFLYQYQATPIIHSGTYFQAFYGGPEREPPMYLKYIVWALAARGNPKYDQYAEVFYERARQHAYEGEMKDYGVRGIPLACVQAWALIATYEAKCMMITRASMSCATCVRLAQIMGFNELDRAIDDIPPPTGPDVTWIEVEEQRRVFWAAFAIDSHISMYSSWPCLIEPANITTRLPMSEQAFSTGPGEISPFLDEALGGAHYSSVASTAVVSQIFRKIVQHVSQSNTTRQDNDAASTAAAAYWEQHHNLNTLLSDAIEFLPYHFRLPQNLRDTGAIYVNLSLRAAVIVLHRTAIEWQIRHSTNEMTAEPSVRYLRMSTEEIANIVRMASHTNALIVNPLCALPLYIATTVYKYIASDAAMDPLSTVNQSNFDLTISALEAIGQAHPVSLVFLQQTHLDVKRNGLDSGVAQSRLLRYMGILDSVEVGIPFFVKALVPKKEISGTLPPPAQNTSQPECLNTVQR